MKRKVGVMLSCVLMVFEVMSTLFLTLFILRTLGHAEFGVYKLAAAINAYLLLLDLGVGNAMVRFISLVERIKNKLLLIYRNRLFKEYTGNDTSSMKILGEINIVNKNIKIGKRVTFFNGVTVFGDGPVFIGDNVSVGENTILYASANGGDITIGSNSQIATQSYIIDMDHGIKCGTIINKQNNIVAPIVIGDDVWIAVGSIILRGSVLEHGSVIGAQSVVKGCIPENAVAVGVPAKVKKYRE